MFFKILVAICSPICSPVSILLPRFRATVTPPDHTGFSSFPAVGDVQQRQPLTDLKNHRGIFSAREEPCGFRWARFRTSDAPYPVQRFTFWWTFSNTKDTARFPFVGSGLLRPPTDHYRPGAVLFGPKAKQSLGECECRVSWFTYTCMKIRHRRPTL